MDKLEALKNLAEWCSNAEYLPKPLIVEQGDNIKEALNKRGLLNQ